MVQRMKSRSRVFNTTTGSYLHTVVIIIILFLNIYIYRTGETCKPYETWQKVLTVGFLAYCIVYPLMWYWYEYEEETEVVSGYLIIF